VPRTGLWLRVFVSLLVAVMPPIVLLVATLLLTETILHEADPDLVAVIVVVGTMVWAAVLAVFFTSGLADEFRSFIALAERGDPSDAAGGDAYRQLATSLEERNRQVVTLAQQASLVPIDDDPQSVVRALVSAVRTVMRDPTWRCAVLVSEFADLLPLGIYQGRDDGASVMEITELERWASSAEAAAPTRHVEGPWGAFAVIDIAVSDRLRAILYAPREGRPAPTPAEIALLSLVGQHAGTALEHSLLYAQVRGQANELERLAAIQADFLRGVTHDLQTPLTSIAAVATELRATEGMPAPADDDLETITYQAERLRRMVGQLLVASRIEAGVISPSQEVFAIQPLVERTWAALRSDRPFDIKVVGDPYLVVADPDRTEQVMWALFDNAVKYSPPGSPVGVKIEPHAAAHLRVSVIDQGTGMDAATRHSAFEQFYRSDRARLMAPDGSGVGLYAARGLVEAMGGIITIDSELGSGTTITVTLPAEQANAEADELPDLGTRG
jgi:signal transduction histidine kinase